MVSTIENMKVIYATEQYRTNLSQVIRGLRKELRQPGTDLLSFADLALVINHRVKPYMPEAGGISPQSLQYWSPNGKQGRELKQMISPVNAQRLGIFLGCDPEVAADWFQRWIQERATGEFPETVSIRDEFRRFIELHPVGQLTTKKTAQYSLDFRAFKIMKRMEEISAEIRELSQQLDRLLAQAPLSLQELLWEELMRAKQQGKLVANIDNPRAVAREFSKLCLNYDPNRLYQVLSGSLIETDLEASELDSFVHGLSALHGEQWERRNILHKSRV